MYGDVLYKDANGLAFRGVDVNNHLWARVRASGLEIGKKDAGADSVLATVPLFTAPADNRRYRIGVRAYGGEVKVTLDGETLISHALSAGDLTKYGAGTMHGFRSHTVSARFTDLVVNSLR